VGRAYPLGISGLPRVRGGNPGGKTTLDSSAAKAREEAEQWPPTVIQPAPHNTGTGFRWNTVPRPPRNIIGAAPEKKNLVSRGFPRWGTARVGRREEGEVAGTTAPHFPRSTGTRCRWKRVSTPPNATKGAGKGLQRWVSSLYFEK
jgi:hypothetical protein